MSTWLYQLNAQDWSPETFRYEIWKGKPWHWRYGRKLAKALPEAGEVFGAGSEQSCARSAHLAGPSVQFQEERDSDGCLLNDQLEQPCLDWFREGGGDMAFGPDIAHI